MICCCTDGGRSSRQRTPAMRWPCRLSASGPCCAQCRLGLGILCPWRGVPVWVSLQQKLHPFMARDESQVLIKSMRVNPRLVTGELHDAAISFFGLGDGPLNQSFTQSTSSIMLLHSRRISLNVFPTARTHNTFYQGITSCRRKKKSNPRQTRLPSSPLRNWLYSPDL